MSWTGDSRSHAPALLRRVWVVLLCAVLGAGVAYVLSINGRAQYTGQTVVLVSQRDAGKWVAQAGVYPVPAIAAWDSVSQVEVAPRAELVKAAVDALGVPLDPAHVLERHTLIEADPVTRLITVSVDDDSLELARSLSRSVAQAFVDWAQNAERRRLAESAEALVQKRQALEDQIVAVRSASAGPAELDNLNRELDATTTWIEQIAALEVVGTLQATLQTKDINASLLGAHFGRALAGAAVGLVLGLGIALIGARSDDTVRSRERAIEIVAGLAANANVLPSAYEHVPRTAEDAAGELRSWLLRSGAAANGARVVVSGVGATTDGEDLGFELARSLVLSGRRVRLILLHEPVRRLMDVASDGTGIGLADVLAGRVASEESITQTSLAGLDFVQLGARVPQPEDLIASKALAASMSAFAAGMDCLVISAGRLLKPHQTDQLLESASAAVYVLRLGAAKDNELAAAVERAAEGHVPRVGVLVTPARGLSHRGQGPRSEASTVER